VDANAVASVGACPECGGPRVDGLSCWEQLGGLIAWEYEDDDLRREHFLTVASYNLQHPAQFTDEAIAGLRSAFVDYLDRGVSIDEIRRRASAATAGAVRVRRDESVRKPVRRSWSTTIADVYGRGQPKAAECVRRWAAAIRREL
jgi:hypothetical protein